MKTLGAWIDYVTNIHDQIRANAEKFSITLPNKRKEAHIVGRIKELHDDYIDAKGQLIKILAAKEENDLKANYLNNEIFIQLKEAYMDYDGELQTALQEEQNKEDTKAATPAKTNRAIDIRLKRIDIPPFKGGYDQWRPFYELYNSLVHSNDTLSDIQKSHYLKASVNGEAARLLQHVSLEEKNYESAWKILVDRYENKRVLVNTYLRILLNQKHLTVETAAGIKDILDTTTECVHLLRNLGVPVDIWDVILIYLLTAKLPTSTQQGWEEHQQGAKNLSELTALTQFLETRFRTLESIEQSTSEVKKSTKQWMAPPSKSFVNYSKNFHTGFSRDHHNHNNQHSIKCKLCNGDHDIKTCDSFRDMNPRQRMETVIRLRACLNCLSFKHTRQHCPSSFRCRECRRNHHSMLHLASPQQTSYQRQAKEKFNNQPRAQHLAIQHQVQRTNITHQHSDNPTQNSHEASHVQVMQPVNAHQSVQSLFTKPMNPVKTLLATALVKCHGANGEIYTLRALIDPGSEATFITEAAVQKLRLPKRKTSTNIISLGQSTTGIARHKTSITITSTYNTKFTLTMEAYVYTNITSILPSEKFEIKHWKHLEGLQLADPIYNVPGKIDILLGADVYTTIILAGLRKGPPGSPIAQNTELGWVISGNVSESPTKTIHTFHQTINLDAELRRFWEIEEVPEQRTLTKEETMCENHFLRTHQRLKDGRYQVQLPFKTDVKPIFINSKQAALSRLHHLERRFQVNPKLRDMYIECLNDYLASGHMIEVQVPNNEESYYLPHHAVFKESSTTKLRVVFDASCKAKNRQSLNDCLLIGPTLQQDLISIIAKWRKFKVAYTADITKMYRQIWIDPRDHGFCDASEKAYAAVVYIRLKTKASIQVQLIMAKTKIAPLKRISLPRVELCAAVLLAKLLKSIKQILNFQTTETFAWTDSMITLAWIKANPSKWKTFVANRVIEIQANTATHLWRHVSTKDNPAGIASRGLFPSEIHQADTWWHGPEFLRQITINYDSSITPITTELECKKIKVLQTTIAKSIIIETIERHSTLNKAVRVLAYLSRAIHNFKQSTNRNCGPLTIKETQIGLEMAIKATQEATFYEERTNLTKKTSVPCKSKLTSLYPFLDENEVLRIGGRLQNSNVTFHRQHPIILPPSSHLTHLIIRDAHLKTIHGGITLTTEHLQNQYWIINAKRTIKGIIKKCIICFRFKAAETKQLMGNLPNARVQIARPFCNTGVDYAGPIEIKAWKGRCNRFYKGYIAIFVCLCTKAMHIELVSDLSTAAFIAAFRRFTARRGICTNLYSDNGTNFIGASNKMTREMKIIKKQWETEISDTLISLGTQWHFIPPAAPHFGGLWEAGVKSIKFHLKRIVNNTKLTFEEYYTLLAQIEACLNSRPLCPRSPDPDDLSTLTPGHFLIMSALNTPPEQDLTPTNIHNLDRWNFIQRLYQTFWDKWSTDYLSRLQQRPKWNTRQPNMKVGNLVLLKEGRMPPTHWQLARITATHPGEDKLIRVVTVKTATSTFQRPIHKVCLLPIPENLEEPQEPSQKINF